MKKSHLKFKSSELQKMFLVNGVEIRNMVRKTRSDGVLICSDNNGYYVAQSETDIDKTIRHLKKRVDSLNNTIKRLEESIDNYGK